MMGFQVIKRQEPLRWGFLYIFPAAVLVAFGLSALLLLLQNRPVWECLSLMYEGAFGYSYALEDTLLKSIPLFLCSLGVSIAFRMQVWNIGAEGQYALGGLGATAVVLAFPNLPMALMLPTMMVAALAAGGLWGMVPGFLRLRFGLNEIISTLMLNYVGIELLRYLVYGPWKHPSSMGFPMTAPFPEAALFPPLFGRIHTGLVVCVVVALLLAVFLQRTRLGFELRASGENPKAALYARMPYGLLLVLVMTMSGALAGLAGCVEVSTTFSRLQPSFCTGYGYTAIVVAWLSRLRIIPIAFFSFFLAGLRVGVDNLQVELQMPQAFGGILEGLILLCALSGQFFYTYRLARSGQKSAAPFAPNTQNAAQAAIQATAQKAQPLQQNTQTAHGERHEH